MKKPLSLIFSVLPHIAAIAVMVACFMLAGWQFDRAEEKRALLGHWDNAPAAGLEQAEDHFSPYAKIHAHGRFDAQRQILLDNQVRNGQAGVHVFTPFVPAGQSRIWLVNRGWHALPSRHGSLPHVDVPGTMWKSSGAWQSRRAPGFSWARFRRWIPGSGPT